MKSLIEWYADKEEEAIEWAEKALKSLMMNILENPYHSGDCTNENHSCNLCTLELLLQDYYEYIKKEQEK